MDVELAERPEGGWILTLKGSNQVESRGPTPAATLGKFVRSNREVLGVDWLDEPDAPPLDLDALGLQVQADPARFGLAVSTRPPGEAG